MASPVDLERVGRASLTELGDIRIDDVLSFIDRGIEKMPSYMDLYRRWESQQWAVSDIDFTLDRQDWIDASEGDSIRFYFLCENCKQQVERIGGEKPRKEGAVIV